MSGLQSPFDRRNFLKLLGSVAGLASLPGAQRLLGAEDATGPLETVAVANNVFTIRGGGSNCIVVYGPDEVVLIDGGVKERTAGIITEIRRIGGNLPIRTLFNTHWHTDGTGMNEALGFAGERIIANENTRLWMTVDVDVKWEHRVYDPLPEVAWPNDTFYDGSRSIQAAGQRIEYGLMPQAHTDGDIYVFLPETNVLAAGDVVSVGSYPILDWCSGGWCRGITDATQQILDITNADTKIIPAQGPVLTRADVEAQYEMLHTVTERLVQFMQMGYSADDMLAAHPTAEFDAVWGDPELFIRNAYPGLWGHARELGKII